MPVQHVLDLDRGDVLAAGDDDVLGAVLDDDVAVLIEHAEVAGVKPAAGKGLLRRLLVLQIALHHDIAAKHDLADGLAIARHLAHGFGIDHGDAFLQRVGHTLPSLQLRTLIGWQIVPARLLGADRRRAIDLGQPVNMRQLDADISAPSSTATGGAAPAIRPTTGARRPLGASGALISVL